MTVNSPLHWIGGSTFDALCGPALTVPLLFEVFMWLPEQSFPSARGLVCGYFCVFTL